MARRHALTFALNAGGVDPEALTRVDLEKMRIAGEHPVDNFLPRELGPVTMFPGTEMLLAVPSNDETLFQRFWRDGAGSYLLLLSANEMRIVRDGALATTPSVSTTVSTTWTDESDGSAVASETSGVLSLTATATAAARLRKALTISAPDQTVEHVLKFVVTRGPVFVRIGTTANGTELMPGATDAELGIGTHFLAFTPGAGTVYVNVASRDSLIARTVTSVTKADAGVLVVPTPWSYDELVAMRVWQSLDVIYVGTGAQTQYQIENRGSDLSWGVRAYETRSGPFVFGPSRVALTNGNLTGNTEITSSEEIFEDGHVGALLEITHNGKVLFADLDGVDQSTDYITVVGVNTGRRFTFDLTPDSFTGTVVMERSFDPTIPTVWSTVATYVNAVNTVFFNEDSQDNVTIHYRFRVSAYTSGSVIVNVNYGADSSSGVARILTRNSSTSVQCEVLKTFGNTTASRTWRISDWSDVRGWPRVPVIHDSRLHWFREDMDFASVVDDYTNFDDDVIGESGPFARSVGSGGESGVLWALSVDRLLAGTSRSEAVIAASELDGALTPTEYSVRRPSRRGSADIAAIEYDDGLAFVQRSSGRIFEMRRPPGVAQFEVRELSRLCPAAFVSPIKRIAVQQQPDLRIYCRLEDGSLGLLTLAHDVTDNVVAITTREISGALVEDVISLPSDDQDDVYLLTNRGGNRYVERLAKEAAQRSVSTCSLLDGHKVLTGSITAISGAAHFADETVQVWADGKRISDVAIDGSGNAALVGGPFARVVYGKRYIAKFQSVKLEHASSLGTALGQIQQVKGAALILHKSCMDGIQIGPDFVTMDPMPEIIDGAERTENQFFDHYEHEITPINSVWQTDARFCVQVDSAEGPVTIQGIVLDVETRDGAEAG